MANEIESVLRHPQAMTVLLNLDRFAHADHEFKNGVRATKFLELLPAFDMKVIQSLIEAGFVEDAGSGKIVITQKGKEAVETHVQEYLEDRQDSLSQILFEDDNDRRQLRERAKALGETVCEFVKRSVAVRTYLLDQESSGKRLLLAEGDNATSIRFQFPPNSSKPEVQ